MIESTNNEVAKKIQIKGSVVCCINKNVKFNTQLVDIRTEKGVG